MAVVTDQFVKIKETEEFTGIWQNTKRYDYAWEKKPTDRKKIKTSESWLVRFRIFIERGHRVDIRPQEQEQQMTVDAWKKRRNTQQDCFWAIIPEALHKNTRAKNRKDPPKRKSRRNSNTLQQTHRNKTDTITKKIRFEPSK